MQELRDKKYSTIHVKVLSTWSRHNGKKKLNNYYQLLNTLSQTNLHGGSNLCIST